MIGTIEQWVKSYRNWLSERTLLETVDGAVEITTPFLNRDNDMIQLYVIRQGSNYELTDDGATLRDLAVAGVRLDTERRRGALESVLNGFGVTEDGGQLVVEVDEHTFPSRKHNLIQAVLAVDDLHYTAHSNVVSFFFEGVVKWLDLNEIRYSPRIKVTGRTGFDQQFDFLIPKSTAAPERFIQAVNRLDKMRAENLAFRWIDIVSNRPENAKFFVLANTIDDRLRGDVERGLAAYQIETVAWADRDKIEEAIAR